MIYKLSLMNLITCTDANIDPNFKHVLFALISFNALIDDNPLFF